MNTDPRGPQVLAINAYQQIGQLYDPWWANGLIAVIGGARKAGNTALADQIVNIAVNEGNAAYDATAAIYIATLLNRWPANPQARHAFSASQFARTSYGNGKVGWAWSVGQQATQEALGLDCQRLPSRTGPGPDGKYGTADDWYTQTYIAGYTWDKAAFLSDLRAARLNLMAMHQCQSVADNPAAVASVAEAESRVDLLAAALYGLETQVNAIWAP